MQYIMYTGRALPFARSIWRVLKKRENVSARARLAIGGHGRSTSEEENRPSKRVFLFSFLSVSRHHRLSTSCQLAVVP